MSPAHKVPLLGTAGCAGWWAENEVHSCIVNVKGSHSHQPEGCIHVCCLTHVSLAHNSPHMAPPVHLGKACSSPGPPGPGRCCGHTAAGMLPLALLHKTPWARPYSWPPCQSRKRCLRQETIASMQASQGVRGCEAMGDPCVREGAAAGG